MEKKDNEKFCSECGQVINIKAEICPKCGVRQHGTEVTPSPPSTKSEFKGGATNKNRMTAAILAFLLGAFGAHKFYLGQTGMGILYLVFFWTFIPALVAFVEFIIYITMSDEDFVTKYA